MSRQANSGRYAHLDLARGVAVILAVFAHFHAQYFFDSGYLPEAWFPRWLLRTSTPTLLVLFGMMLELVYLRKCRAGLQMGVLRRRLVLRAVTLYSLCLLLAVVAYLGGKISLTQMIAAVFNLGDGRFDEILRMYAAFLVAAAVLLPWMARHGAAKTLAAVAVVGWALKYGFTVAGLPNQYTLHAFFGHGWGFGPAVLPSFSLLAFGAFLGEVAAGRRSTRFCVAACGALGALFLWKFSFEGPYAFADQLYHWRWTNHPNYYLFGAMASVTIILQAEIIDRRAVAAPLQAVLRMCGKQSLFVYAFGNFLLNAMPRRELDLINGITLGVVFFAIVIGLALDRGRESPIVDDLTFGTFRAASRLYGQALNHGADRVQLAILRRPRRWRQFRPTGDETRYQ